MVGGVELPSANNATTVISAKTPVSAGKLFENRVKMETRNWAEREGERLDSGVPDYGKLTTKASAIAPRFRAMAESAMDEADRMRVEGGVENENEAKQLSARAINTNRFADAFEKSDTFGAKFLSSLLGIVEDPYADHKKLTRQAVERGLIFSPEEQVARGYVAPTSSTPKTTAGRVGKEMGAYALGQVPLLGAESMALRGVAGAAKMLRARGAGRLSSLLDEAAALNTRMGPRAAGTVGLRESAGEFIEEIPALMRRGSWQGNVAGAATDYRLAQQEGDPDPLARAVEGLVIGGPAGALLEPVFEGVGRTLGRGMRTLSNGVKGVGPSAIAAALDQSRVDDGKTPVSGKTPEAQEIEVAAAEAEVKGKRAELLGELETFRDRYPDDVGRAADARDAEYQPAGEGWWKENVPAEPTPGKVVVPETYNGARRPAPDTPLRTSVEIASEKAGIEPPSPARAAVDAEDMSRNMERIEAEQAAADAQERIAQAATTAPDKKQGPLMFGQTIARAVREGRAGSQELSTHLKQLRDNSPAQYNHAVAGVAIGLAGQKADDEDKGWIVALASLGVASPVIWGMGKMLLEHLDDARTPFHLEHGERPRDVWANAEVASESQPGLNSAELAKLPYRARQLLAVMSDKWVERPILVSEGIIKPSLTNRVAARIRGERLPPTTVDAETKRSTGFWLDPKTKQRDANPSVILGISGVPGEEGAITEPHLLRAQARIGAAKKQFGLFHAYEVDPREGEPNSVAVVLRMKPEIGHERAGQVVEGLLSDDGNRRFSGASILPKDPNEVMIVVDEGADPREVAARAKTLYPDEVFDSRITAVKSNYVSRDGELVDPKTGTKSKVNNYEAIVEDSGGLSTQQAAAQSRAERAHVGIARVARGIATEQRISGAAEAAARRVARSPEFRTAATITGASALAGAAGDDEDKRNLALAAGSLAVAGGRVSPELFSRVARAVEGLPKRWDEPRSAAEWLQKLDSDKSFNRREYELVLRPELERLARGESSSEHRIVRGGEVVERAIGESGLRQLKEKYAIREDNLTKTFSIDSDSMEPDGGQLVTFEKPSSKLTRADVLDLAKQNAIQIDQVRLTEKGDPITPGRGVKGQAEEKNTSGWTVDTEERRNAGPTESAIWDELESEIENAKSEEETYARDLNRAAERSRGTLEELGVGMDSDAVWHDLVGDIHDAINESGEGHWDPSYRPPRNSPLDRTTGYRRPSHHDVLADAVQKALDRIETKTEPELPAGYELRESISGPSKYHIADGTGRVMGKGDTPFEAMADLPNPTYPEFGNLENMFRGFEVGQFEGEWQASGKYADNVGYGETRAEAVENFVRENFNTEESRDDLSQEISDAINSYAEEYGQYEYWRSENSYLLDGGDYAVEMREHDLGEAREQDEADGWVPPSSIDLPEGSSAAKSLVRENISLESKGRAGWAGTQRVPGGTNYRELINRYVNRDGPAFRGHSFGGGSSENVAVWVRASEHRYVPATEEVRNSPELARLSEARDRMADEMRDLENQAKEIVGRHLSDEEMEAAARGNPALEPIREKAQELRSEIDEINNEYERTETALAHANPDAEPELVLNGFEWQSDHKQKGEAAGFGKSVTAMDPAEARRLRVPLDAEHARVERELDALRDRYTELRNGLADGRGYMYLGEIRGERQALDAERDEVLDQLTNLNRQTQPRLLPDRAEAERLARRKVKLQEELDALEEKANEPSDEGALTDAEYDRKGELEKQIRKIDDAPVVPETVFDTNETTFGLAAATLLYEAALSDVDRIAWSTAEARNKHPDVLLSLKAGKATYDVGATSAVKRRLAELGYKNVVFDKIKLGGYSHWSVKATPEMKETIKRVGLSMLSLMAIAGMPSTLRAQGKKEDEEAFVKSAGLGGNAAAIAVVALGLAAMRRGGHKFKPFSAPLEPALRMFGRVSTPAAMAGLAYVLSQQKDRNFSDMAPWVAGLGALNAIGMKNLAKAGDKSTVALLNQLKKVPFPVMGAENMAQFLNPEKLLVPEVREALDGWRKLRSKGAAKGQVLSARAKKLGGAGDRAVSDIIESEAWEDIANIDPKKLDDVFTVAAAIEKEQAELTQLMVSEKLLPEGTSSDGYLKRFYAEWEAYDVMANTGGRTSIAPQKKNPRIGGEKTRTLDIPIREAEAELSAAKASGDAARIAEAESKVGEARAVSYSQRLERGELREASFRVGRSFPQKYADVAAAKLFRDLRGVSGVIHPEYLTALDEFMAAREMYKTATSKADKDVAKAMMDEAELKRLTVSRQFSVKGGGYVSLPDNKSLGVLKGMVVTRDVANSLNGVPNIRTVDKVLQWWKLSKTVANPGTHIANVISNLAVSHMHGLYAPDLLRLLPAAAMDLKKYNDAKLGRAAGVLAKAATRISVEGKAAQALAEAGVLDLNSVTAGAEGAVGANIKSEKGLRELLSTTRPETAKVLRDRGVRESSSPRAVQAVGKIAGKAWGAVKETYANEDNLFRIAMYYKRLEEGKTHEVALADAVNSFADFRSSSPALALLRRGPAPFVLYTAKMVPVFAKSIIEHPYRYMGLVAAWAALDTYSQQQVGRAEDEDIPLEQRRKAGYFFPGVTQLPFGDAQEGRGATDLARWTPMSGVTDIAPPGSTAGAFSERYPRVFSPQGPMQDIYAKFANNYDPFKGTKRYKADWPLGRKLGQLAEDVGDVALPSALTFHRRRIADDIRNKDVDALKNDLLGPTGFRPRFIRPGDVAMRSERELRESLLDATSELKRNLNRSNDPARDDELWSEYDAYVDEAYVNFEKKVNPPPRVRR